MVKRKIKREVNVVGVHTGK